MAWTTFVTTGSRREHPLRKSAAACFEDPNAASGLGRGLPRPLGIPGSISHELARFLAVNASVVTTRGAGARETTVSSDAESALPEPRYKRSRNARRARGAFKVERGPRRRFGDVDNDGTTRGRRGKATGQLHRSERDGSRNPGPAFARRRTAAPEMLGSRVAVSRKDGPTLWRRVRSTELRLREPSPRGSSASVRRRQSPRFPCNGRTAGWKSGGVPIDRWTTRSREGR